ncbi:uncharacterized protein LOC111694891 [Eurytemora carolleeae]|uniref:uncharacterized protein LOC111694891 n=1 Tax=Eurytemora carolleeae TaxID=1294199 RepID=UPI000C75FF3B|nr:uncharacterized protein LOC111694891 [Eurytemora carolleeae]|eukprot:XP_023319715.1 uncharacterized protein LOC111694891 [Eurytemora affinis]
MSSLVRQMIRPIRVGLHHKSSIIFQQIQPFPVQGLISILPLHTSAVVERARQSTRLRKRKVYMDNKKKKEERLRKNPPPIPHKVQLMLKAKGFGSKPIDWRARDEKPFPFDDTWDEQWFTWRRLSVPEALSCLREHYHPTQLDNPNGIVLARIEIDMSASRKEKYIEAFTKMVPLYNAFERGVSEKMILAFAKNEESLDAARNAGATKVGGLDLIEDISKGKVEVIDYDYFLAHDDISLELRPLLGVLREKFPKKTLGTIGTDLEKMVKTFKNGQLVEVKKPKSTLGYNDDPAFGYCEAQVGRLGMPDDQIFENFTNILESLRESAPKRSGGFITRVQFYMDGYLKSKFSVHHDLIDDAKYKAQIKNLNAVNQ